MGTQHVLKEDFASPQFVHKPPEAKRPDRRSVFWTRRPGQADGPFRVRCEFFVSLEVQHPSAAMARTSGGLYAAPHAGAHRDRAARNGADVELLGGKARELTAGLNNKADMAEAVYVFVAHEITNYP